MARVTASRRNIKKPAPELYRKFENAYFAALAPAIASLIMGWGFSSDVTNKLTLVLVLLGALIKAIGMILANGQVYADKSETNKDDGAVIPSKGF